MHRRLVVLTGRRSDPHEWLRHYGLEMHLDDVVFNGGSLRNPHFKLGSVEALGAREHIDDDGRTAQLIAEVSSARSYLRDWPRNRNAAYSPDVTRVADLASLVDDIEAASLAGDSAQT